MSNPSLQVRNSSLQSRLTPLIARARPLIVFGIEIAIILISAFLAFLLRFDFSVPDLYVPVLIVASIVWVSG